MSEKSNDYRKTYEKDHWAALYSKHARRKEIRAIKHLIKGEDMETKELTPTKGYEKMPLQIIVHLQGIEIDEFYAEDSDDRKSESGKSLGWIKRDIDKTLALADPNPDIQIKLYDVCSLGFSMAHPEDGSYKPLADAMRDIGYTIVTDVKEQKRILRERRKSTEGGKTNKSAT